MLELASEMALCLLIAAIIGGIIGYLLGKITKCKQEDREYLAGGLNDYNEQNDSNGYISTKSSRYTTPTASLKDSAYGIAPKQFDTPQSGRGDNLKDIKGIGLSIEVLLNKLGIYHYEQIASWDKDNVSWIEKELDFKGRINREEWISQAQILSTSILTKHNKNNLI